MVMAGDAARNKALPKLALTEITLGRMLGQGGFSVVSKVEAIDLQEVYDTSDEDAKLRAGFSSSMRDTQYVMKTLRTDLPEEEYTKGIVDLAIEADFLSVLSHENVISMRALANSDPHESKFFVILDRLVVTLDRKFNHWRKVVGENIGFWFGPFGYCCSKEPPLHQAWMERIAAARDIANAMYYLHSNAIVYRDLKPDNVGFDASGNLKVFDFGLAKRLNPADKGDDGLYLMTANTGSLRYMAPEVARGEAYNQRVDAYSFGILFWQICSLQTPYAGFSTRAHAEQVVQNGHRPKPDRSWPQAWTVLMMSCWNHDFQQRPDFDEIAVNLDEQVDELHSSDGEVPNRASEIRAKNKKKPNKSERLDVDTRLSTPADGAGTKRFDKDVV
uniref:Protein kinase domain-containing protein n=1 Tax=Craspedostauros australis TaxID=1486917 RepID=A0A7R9ZN64_9STRA|mmetsp:Transcript_251/g.691  ORF Transcript_251/g.691 Transcript_251/m.691 type:complete len:388 (+) Transcript_251:309-1472(+)|eukprot:CAMPEP_0198114374 /NCGR_PEP_ID=MMETSP1442-20131203/5779_1 /TAXON_ID= /ORGANISM="Craspedostauros australis, Strain CCMP3328" /LENGTH=387 /DNA_ID=CAMNT_0043771677 /DNA_START=297 /DNA_END=1460 /DNA_ORIENTATION=+